MGTKIKLATELGGHKVGDTIEVTPKTAEYLTEQGHVEVSKKADSKTTAAK